MILPESLARESRRFCQASEASARTGSTVRVYVAGSTEPISIPPSDCQTFCPSVMAPEAMTTLPSGVTMRSGIGGAC